MGAWRVVGDIAGPVAAAAVLLILVWGAIERGRVRQVTALHCGLRKDAAALLACGMDRRGLFGLFRTARHASRVHLAACAVGQWA